MKRNNFFDTLSHDRKNNTEQRDSMHTMLSHLKVRYVQNRDTSPHALVGLSRSEYTLYKDIIEHGLNVARYARMLFEDLEPLHMLGMKWQERLLLAAQYHDIGTIDGEKAHHKHSYVRIKTDKNLAILEEEREVVALIARYHRRALPSHKHAEFACLPQSLQENICKVASILRIADALDYGHEAHIKRVRALIFQKQIRLDCLTDKGISLEKIRVEKKGDLFRRTFQKEIECKIM